MAMYKCIGCGQTRESETGCTCPYCGYRMYPAPYNRKQVLADEINRFVSRLMLDEVKADEIKYFRTESPDKESSSDGKQKVISKEDDDQRFPSFDKIQTYICSSKKTEEFFSRLDTSIEKLKEHIHEPYQRDYELKYDILANRITEMDPILKAILKKIGVSADFPTAVFPKVVLDYREEPNGELIEEADELLEMLDKLSAKIKKFIKLNNIYGNAYRKEMKPKLKQSKDRNYGEELNDIKRTVERALAKKYVVDIFSDGSDELQEQLKVLWTAIYAIMELPVLEKKYYYRFEDGDVKTEENFTAKIAELVRIRYGTIRLPLIDEDYLAGRDEDSIFNLYNMMIELDTHGLMGIDASQLIRIGESEAELNRLIGLSDIKDRIRKIKAYALANKNNGDLNIHMCFYGNPGTGKTEVARIIAGILYENKILPTNKVVEVDRGGLIGQFVGETPLKTMDKIQQAMGGVLFVDEAYALIPKDGGRWDYGHEAVATLIKAMEDYRGKFCVILAGYRNQMIEMLSSNPGFKSRIQFELDFPNFDRDELRKIANLMLEKRGYTITDTAMEKILDVTDIKRKEPNFANAREIRNILDNVIMCQNVRAIGTDDHELGIADVNRYITDSKINLPTGGEGSSRKILTGEEELNQLVGLTAVKRMVKKIKAYAKRNAGERDFNIHMCFYGNPGTGKTEVARILSRILYDAGALPESKLVETDSSGLMGKVVGETGPKTREKVKEAMGGVLFVDEAYGLNGTNSASGTSTNYGDEAIAVLLKEMEDHRGQFCVILAGYKDEMKKMLSTNPGFESRIQFTLDFPDYTKEELGEIAKVFLTSKKYEITQEALSKFLEITEYYRNRPNFANARTVRNILDQVIMNQNLRAEDDPDDYTIIIDDIEDYLTDEKIDLRETVPRRKIGF